MSPTLSLIEMAHHFAQYINRVAYRGESFVLVRGNKPLVELRPLPTGKRLAGLPALLALLPHLSQPKLASSPPTSRQRGRHSPVQRSTIRGSLE